jgi:hypothetical protein
MGQKNLRSAIGKPDIVQENICKEVLAGRLLGPF